MPTSDGYYYDQKRLGRIFLISSLGLLAATIWMLAEDHVKAWKGYQRQFNSIRRDKLVGDLERQRQALDEQKLADLKTRLQEAHTKQDQRRDQLSKHEADLARLRPLFERQEERYQFAKADWSEATSTYDSLVKELADPAILRTPAQQELLQRKRDRARSEIERLARLMAERQETREKTAAQIKAAESAITAITQDAQKLEKELGDLTSGVDKLQRSIAASVDTTGASLRSMMILDAFSSPLKIRQVALEKLPLNYNFTTATRHDRCMTCHVGIDQTGYLAPHGVAQPYCSHPDQALYVGSKSPHPVEKFGCTICHQGQGSATTFEWASHMPIDTSQREGWKAKYGWFFNHFHKWPMRPGVLIESSCLQCHHDPYQVPVAKTLLLGYQSLRRYGCFGCHEIDGYKNGEAAVGPHLRIAQKADSQLARARSLRKVGPNLARIAEKLTPEVLRQWIRNPLSLRPTTRMPRHYHPLDEGFFGDGPEREFDATSRLQTLANTEIYAIAHFLLTRSRQYLEQSTSPQPTTAQASGDSERGRELFLSKGCLACHLHKDQPRNGYSKLAQSFGPGITNLAAKFPDPSRRGWLASWIKDPSLYNSNSFMPVMQLSDQDASDLAEYLLTCPTLDIERPTIPELNKDALQELAVALGAKGGSSRDARSLVASLDDNERLMYVGSKTIARLGCFGCHDIPDEELQTLKSIGPALTGWGRKDPHQLAFENVPEYLARQLREDPEGSIARFYDENEYFLWALDHKQREGFIVQKLRQPRSYDYMKIRRWVERARMPRFNFTGEQVRATATFVLGLVHEQVDPDYLFAPEPPRATEIAGRELLERYNCTSCHVIKPGEYRCTPDEDTAEVLTILSQRELGKDYTFPDHPAWNAPPGPQSTILLRGLPAGREDPDDAMDPDDPLYYVRTWVAASLGDQVVPAGTKVGIPTSQMTPENVTPPYGGAFAEQLVEQLVEDSDDPDDPGARDLAWQRSVPPLIWEGEKVQTPWLYRFLKDPASIRPSVTLRMPRFRFDANDMTTLADYFAAVDGVTFPYADLPQRDETYLAQKTKDNPAYLTDCWRLITEKDLCAKCHPMAGLTPNGKPEELGPSLVSAPQRVRPDWLLRWIANPKRLLPYTNMPVNFEKAMAAQLPEEMRKRFANTETARIEGARDALINYDKIVEQLVTPVPPPSQVPSVTPPPGTQSAPSGK